VAAENGGICQPRSEHPGSSPSAQREPQVPPLRGTLASKAFCNNFHSLNWERIHLPQLTAAQELQIKAQKRLASLMEEKLVTRISVLSTLLGGGKTTERLLVRISIETHKTSPDFDQTAADKAKNRIKQALGEIGCDVFIETDR
jgi:hypothetical protein